MRLMFKMLVSRIFMKNTQQKPLKNLIRMVQVLFHH